MALNTPSNAPEQNDSVIHQAESNESISALDSTKEGLRALMGEILGSVEDEDVSEEAVLAELEAGGEISPEVKAAGTEPASAEVVRGSARALLAELERDERGLGMAYANSTVATV